MGFFSSLKKNFKHGGVNVSLQAPASIPMQDSTVPVTVSVTATDSTATINKIRAEIIAEYSQNEAFSRSQDNNVPSSTQPVRQTLVAAEDNQAFVLQPGETKTISISLAINVGSALDSQVPAGSGVAQIANVFQKIESVSEAMHPNMYTYEIQASADVDGITLDPSDSHPIQILKPGQIGTAFNIKL